MASNDFISRFKNKTFLMGKLGLMPVAFTNAIDKSEVPSSKIHETSLSPEKRGSETTLVLRPLLPIQLSRNGSHKPTMKQGLSSKSPLPVSYTNRSKSPFENASELILKGSHSRLPRISVGIEKSQVKVMKKLITTIND
jgi:hypothetical protein